jgi:DNA polymerase-1
MRLRGLPFDPDIHAEVIRSWEAEFATKRREFEQLTSAEAPCNSNAVREWLTTRLSEDALQSWKRTESGMLSTEASEIKRMALDWLEVRPLLALRRTQKRLEAFGSSLVALVSLSTGRLHGDYRLPMITGRMSCSRPNLQNLPTDARRAMRAPEGRMLVVGDFAQIELRTAGELSGDENMKAAFAAGEDLHARFARMMLGERYDQLPEDKRKLEREKAKAGHFGNLFAQTVPGFRKNAWTKFDLDLTMDEADAICSAFYEMYPRIGPYQQDQFRQGRFGTLYSIAGRPRRACWEKDRMMWLQLCANYRVQSSAADTLLEAIRRVDHALPGTLVAAVHDELLLEVDEARAEHAAEVLEEEMTAAFRHWFPAAPIIDLVEIKIVSAWADAKS